MPRKPIMLETPRLFLREMTLEDVDPLFEVFGDPVAMRYFPAPYTREQLEASIARNQERYRTLGFGLWTAIAKDTHAVVGDCGPTIQTVEGRDELEIGYHFLPAYQGRGYATEAAAACLAWGFEHTGYERIISMMVVSHGASRRVAEKIHTRYLGEFERVSLPHCYYGTTRAEYSAR
ncbi:GNAT family N-acetyltransferase [bacterium]|nr:GNAT family N-acetyltransferase [bacterium]